MQLQVIEEFLGLEEAIVFLVYRMLPSDAVVGMQRNGQGAYPAQPTFGESIGCRQGDTEFAAGYSPPF
ncbi:MAG: hypothetical protein H0U53_02330 [Actinobacteria bacterium]|nr:hypothetical protein [Actinomycetota bacterium]